MYNRLQILCFTVGVFFMVVISGNTALAEKLEDQNGRGDWAKKVIKKIDTNGNGEISAEEFSDFRMKRFKAADENHDGSLARSEFDQRNLHQSSGRAAKRFDRMDANGDGSISLEEFQVRDGKIFSRIDSNRDGYISKEELSEIGSVRSPDPAHEYIRNTLEWTRF